MIRIYLFVLAALFALFGVGYLIFPETFATAAGISADAGGRTDVRATYGGFQLGFAGFLVWSASAPARQAGALLSVALVVGAIGTSRLFGLAVDGSFTSFHAMALGFEIPVTVCSVLLHRRAA